MTLEFELAALHQPRLRFAMRQLRHDSAAEDVVSETMLAILEKPDKALQQSQFFDALQTCVDSLPAKTGRVFMMCEWLEKEVDDICLELGITSSHCGVMLYRARMQLRECLGRSWFGAQR